MPLLIDGHNVIGRMPDLSLADPEDESKLTRRVRQYCLRHRRRATLVFDGGLLGGRSPTLSTPEVEVVFASTTRSADAVIRARLKKARDPAGLLVVSSDRAIQAAARARGARVVPAEDFVAELAPQPPAEAEPSKPEAPGNVEEWLELFQEEA
jgi:predicted RNA-binding protein with PIN domain